jgi:NCS1 family nucleobase:cation symporter-1
VRLFCDRNRTKLDLAALYDARGPYAYTGRGESARADRAGAGRGAQRAGLPDQIGVMAPSDFWTGIYHYAWFIGFLIAFVFYYVLMAVYRPGKKTVVNEEAEQAYHSDNGEIT